MRGEYGCLMLSCDFKSWDKCLSLVPQEFVYDDDTNNYGLTKDPHVTVLFGFHKDSTDVKDVQKYVESIGRPIVFNIVGVSRFDNPKFIVLKLDVESKDLEGLNKFFKDKFKYTNEHKVYHAHITLSYIRKEFGDKIPDDFKFKTPYKLSSSKFLYNDGRQKLNINSVSPKKSLNEDSRVQMGTLGYIDINQILAPNKDSDLFITHLEINDNLRGQGHFKQFLSDIIKYAQTNGKKNIFLEPDITKGREYTKFLTDLYTKYGFKPVENDPSLMVLSV